MKPRPARRGAVSKKRYVYVIGAANHDAPWHKIGIARNPEQRLKALDTGNPLQLKIKFLHGPTKNFFQIERAAHKMLAAQRMDGEWFSVSAREAIRTVKRAAGAKKRRGWIERIFVLLILAAVVAGAVAFLRALGTPL